MQSKLSMTQSRFFQLSLSFPFLLWLIGLIVFAALSGFSYSLILNHLFDATRVFIPYFIFAAVLWKLAKNRTYGQLTLIALTAPVVWGLFFVFFFIVSTWIANPVVDRTSLWMMAFWATVIAYVAEIIPYVVLSIFRNNFSQDDQPKKSSGMPEDIRQPA